MDARSLTRSLVSAAMLTPAKSPVAKLAFVFSLWCEAAFREASVAEAEVGRLPRLRQAWLLMCRVRAVMAQTQ